MKLKAQPKPKKAGFVITKQNTRSYVNQCTREALSPDGP